MPHSTVASMCELTLGKLQAVEWLSVAHVDRGKNAQKRRNDGILCLGKHGPLQTKSRSKASAIGLSLALFCKCLCF
jgi:hypothetical protein